MKRPDLADEDLIVVALCDYACAEERRAQRREDIGLPARTEHWRRAARARDLAGAYRRTIPRRSQ